jgi:hypothetical protein
VNKSRGDADFSASPLACAPTLLGFYVRLLLQPFFVFSLVFFIGEEFFDYGEQSPCEDFDFFFRNLDFLRLLSQCRPPFRSFRFGEHYKGLRCRGDNISPVRSFISFSSPLNSNFILARLKDFVK